MRLAVDSPKLDPAVLAPFMIAATKHLGIVATACTTFYHPFMAARLFRTLDHLTNGRVGINLVTGSPHAAAQNFGYPEHFEHALYCESQRLPNLAFYLDDKALPGNDGKVVLAKVAAMKLTRIIWKNPKQPPPEAHDDVPAAGSGSGQ